MEREAILSASGLQNNHRKDHFTPVAKLYGAVDDQLRTRF
jgi:hypothetical protein